MASSDLTSIVQALIEQESLPDSYAETVRQTVLPLAQHIQNLRQERRAPILVGINGAQGTGKSTLTLFLRELLARLYRLPTANLSIDDLYLTRAEREHLSQELHPLFLTRGVPGTHDLALGTQVIDRLMGATPGDQTAMPIFDKATDDRAPEADWPVFKGKAEVVLLEGWCVGAQPAKSLEELERPINELEATEDEDCVWRRYVNQRLKNDYSRFFDRLDCLIMLKAPSMECVLEWRTLQEHKLRAKIESAPEGCAKEAAKTTRLMTDQEVKRFIMHYERITRACLDEMPARADALVHVNSDHTFSEPLIRQRH